MKVLIISSLYYPNGMGGAEKNTQVVAEGFAKRNIEVVVVTTSDRDYVDYINGVKVYYVKTRNLYWGFTAKQQKNYRKPLWHLVDSCNYLMAKKVEAIIKQEKPDVAQTNTLSGFSVAVWAVLKKHGIPILHLLHDHYLLCLKTTMFSGDKNCQVQCPQCKALSIPKRKLSSLVNTVAGVSNYIIDRHLDYGFFTQTGRRIRLFNLFDIPNTAKRAFPPKLRFGFVGLLSQGKGIEHLCSEFARLKATNVFIFGKGESPEYEENLKLKFNSDNIKFMGYNSNLKEVYSSFDILIIPSLWNESAGRVVIEAYSYGLPVIASNRGGIPEFVEKGKTGLVFDPDVPRALTEKVSWFLFNRDRMDEMSGNCLSKARELSKDNVIEKYIKAHLDLIEDHNRL